MRALNWQTPTLGTSPAALRITPVVKALVTALAVTMLGCGVDDRPANWSYIHAAIVVPNCTTSSCHTSFNAQAGVRLSDRMDGYGILLGRNCEDPPASAPTSGNFVVPGEPENSRLIYLLVGDDVARAMPPDRPLPDTDIALIERWILRGAPCD